MSVGSVSNLPSDGMQLIKQGAEARIYLGQFLGRSTIVKERFSKSYRHPTLDHILTSRRIRAEVKCIQRCRSNGIYCPSVYFVDQESNKIYMEYIADSVTVKEFIKQQQSTSASGAGSSGDAVTDAGARMLHAPILMSLANEIGRIIGTMHYNHVVHGDLTTSNLLLVGAPEDLHVAVIDFGLSGIEESAEDKAVDLYVLERALLSTHPLSEPLFGAILDSYKEAYISNAKVGKGAKKGGAVSAAAEILRKLDEVRLRGRKRTMVG